jgi:hypothetical protein
MVSASTSPLATRQQLLDLPDLVEDDPQGSSQTILLQNNFSPLTELFPAMQRAESSALQVALDPCDQM